MYKYLIEAHLLEDAMEISGPDRRKWIVGDDPYPDDEGFYKRQWIYGYYKSGNTIAVLGYVKGCGSWDSPAYARDKFIEHDLPTMSKISTDKLNESVGLTISWIGDVAAAVSLFALLFGGLWAGEILSMYG